MQKIRIIVPVKLQLFLPVFVGIIISVFVVTWAAVVFFRNEVSRSVQNNLVHETETIAGLLEREKNFKEEKVAVNIKVARNNFLSSNFKIVDDVFLVNIINQNTHTVYSVELNKWFLDGRLLYGDTVFVDQMHNLFGGTVTVFQKTDSGFVRIATNVLTEDNVRAVGTYIPNYSSVAQAILNRKSYVGRAFVVDDWYITAYEPIFYNNQLVGMLYVGNKEKDLDYFKKTIENIHLGESGFVFIIDGDKNIITKPSADVDCMLRHHLFDTVIEKKKGTITLTLDCGKKQKQFIVFRYVSDFGYYIIASVTPRVESRSVIRRVIVFSVLTAVFVILIFSLIMYYFTTTNVQRFLQTIEISNKKLLSAREALKDSENRYRLLFNSTSDDIFVMDTEMNIIEVNNRACETLGYSREELRTMNMRDIKPAHLKGNVESNRDKVISDGNYTYESEHLTKGGSVVPVEMNCRLVEYNGKKYILSVSRNIAERKKSEREILGAVIRAEEKERERMSKDLHDGLGPLLSTIKLYVSELIAGNLPEKEKEEINKYALELIDESIATTRVISNNLMPRAMSDYGLVKSVETFCKKINLTSKLRITFDAGSYVKQSQTVEVIVYRVINELINNTLKHASAQHAAITLSVAGDVLEIGYSDDGIGFDFDQMLTDPRSGIGLKNIISRIKSLNGTINVTKPAEKGFGITIRIRSGLEI